ncbi:signal-induced proliferation-associated 1-like protein 1 [Hyalella azteca]|uniref:Signal-induced proliferation-associated 1-like protein 1 n=1 Tax=Hyalella azteca TaxID=294128 RepID=A0A979FPS4_HYAAZ|nr:signal-induced proliferation-associated 1-like protein 1 [Hyalella azteca]
MRKKHGTDATSLDLPAKFCEYHCTSTSLDLPAKFCEYHCTSTSLDLPAKFCEYHCTSTSLDLPAKFCEYHCTSTSLDLPAKFSLMGFSRGLSSRRDKARALAFCPAPAVPGALAWSLLVTDYSLHSQVVCTVGVSLRWVAVVEAATGAVLLSVPTRAVLGWTCTPGVG